MEGITGSILVGVESTYGTEATTKVAQYGISSNIGTRRSTARSKSRLSARATRSRQMSSFTDGEIACGFTRADAVVGGVLGALGTGTSGTGIVTYAIGDSDIENDSLTIARNYGGIEYTGVGNVPSSFRLGLGNDDADYTLGVAGKQDTKEASVSAFTAPDEANILYPSAYGALTIDSTTFDFISITPEVSIPVAYKGVSMVGAATVRRAFISGPMALSCSINLEFDDDAGASMDTVSLLDAFLSDGDMGTVKLTADAVDWLVMSNCQATGDWPALQAGVQEFALSFDMGSMDIVTTT